MDLILIQIGIYSDKYLALTEQTIYFHSPKLQIIIQWRVFGQLLSTCCADKKKSLVHCAHTFIFFEAIKLICAQFP